MLLSRSKKNIEIYFYLIHGNRLSLQKLNLKTRYRDMYSILLGVVSGFISVSTFQLLPKKLNAWVRGIISILIVAVIALIIRLVFGPIGE